MKVESLEELLEILRNNEIFEGIGFGISVVDLDFRLLYQNTFDKELAGEHVGEFCYQAYERRTQVCADCPLALSFREGNSHTGTRTSPSRHGTMTIEITASPIKDKTGKIIAGLEIVGDITERALTEERLRESEERYRSVYTMAPLAFVLWDRQTRVTDWNDQAQRIFGWSREEIIGNNFFDYIIPETARTHVQEVVKLLLEGKLPSHSINENLTKSGQTIMCEWNNAILRDDQGGILGVMSLGLDVTARKKLEEELEEAALTDDLTDVLNRRGFYTLAEQLIKMAHRSNQRQILLFMDMDNMKKINDEFGHYEGDLALREMAGILKKTFRESDIIARMGGDEFAVLMTEPSRPGIEQDIISKLKSRLAARNEQTDKAYALSISVGASTYDPERPISVSELLSRADACMYENKKQAGGRR